MNHDRTDGLPDEVAAFVRESPYWSHGAVYLSWVDGKGPAGSCNCWPSHPPEWYREHGLSVFVRGKDRWERYA